jgi:hypothetical protein
MVWNIKTNIFGIDLDLDIKTSPPAQRLYDLRLKLVWERYKSKSSDQSKDFMYYALCHLPEDSFIIFSFDDAGEYFIQFANMNGNIVLDIPFLPTNHYYKQEKKIINLLQSMHLEMVGSKPKDSLSNVNKFWINKKDKNCKTIRASFGKFHIWAGVTAVLIIEEIFKIKEPPLFHFETARLVPVS